MLSHFKQMRQITLLNACLFLYVLLSAKPFAENDVVCGFLAVESSKLDQVIDCIKNKSCTNSSHLSIKKFGHVKTILFSPDITNLSFFSYAIPTLRSFQIQFFYLPIYRYYKTGLSPPSLS